MLLGGKCVKCGFLDFRALQLDHINGNGAKELKQGPAKIYGYYLAHSDEVKKKLQVLCANCNWIKRFERQETNRKDIIILNIGGKEIKISD